MHERETDTHIYFWGGEFSNWYTNGLRSQFKYKGITFFNSEQAFMWEKAVFFGDMEIAKKIVETPNPKENKALGRKIRGFDTERWMVACFPIMVAVNYAKYSQSHMLKRLLLETEDKTLVEASPLDKIWGIGVSWQDDDCLDEMKWKGMNLLGKALMEVRKQLKEETSR